MKSCSILLVLSALLIAGCSSSVDNQGFFKVDGTVTYDGQPLDNGWITFRSQGGDAKNVAAQIEGGKFSVKIQEGVKLVEISAEREVPGKFSVGANGEKVPAKESFIPAIYNTKSELKTTVKYPATEGMTFDLQAK